MGRYIAAQRRNDLLITDECIVGYELFQELDSAGINYELATIPVGDEGGDADCLVFEADYDEVSEALANGQAHRLWIEEEVQYRTARDFVVNVKSSDQSPIPGALVEALVARSNAQGERKVGCIRSRTDAHGVATLDIPEDYVVDRVEAHMANFWPSLSREQLRAATIECERISFPSSHLGWWHEMVGIKEPIKNSEGQGIRIGIIDTAVADHSALKHVDRLGGFDNDLNRSRDAGGDSHGTHVCGIIGSRPIGNGFAGVAPGASISCMWVEERPNQAAITSALSSLVADCDPHLINLSFEADRPSMILSEAIERAYGNGCLLFSAAGNSNGTQTRYPARNSNVVAVTALGKSEEYPMLSVSRMFENMSKHRNNGSFVASFSCRGMEVNCCAPGVGIVSTSSSEGENQWECMDGTSMASPLACGVLASRLSKNEGFLRLNGSKERSQAARSVLRSCCKSAGFDSDLEGDGIPHVE